VSVFAWLMTALSIAGTVLVVRRRPKGFALWVVSNVGWVVIDWRAGLISQAALFVVYLALSLWGIWEWRRERR